MRGFTAKNHRGRGPHHPEEWSVRRGVIWGAGRHFIVDNASLFLLLLVSSATIVSRCGVWVDWRVGRCSSGPYGRVRSSAVAPERSGSVENSQSVSVVINIRSCDDDDHRHIAHHVMDRKRVEKLVDCQWDKPKENIVLICKQPDWFLLLGWTKQWQLSGKWRMLEI